MTAKWIQEFIDENTMDGYMGEPAVGVEKVLELVAKVAAEALEKAAKVVSSQAFRFDGLPEHERKSIIETLDWAANGIRALSPPAGRQGGQS